MTQLALGSDGDRPYTTRERVLASTLAGFRWPGRRSFERLTKRQQEIALQGARLALEHRREEEPDGGAAQRPDGESVGDGTTDAEDALRLVRT